MTMLIARVPKAIQLSTALVFIVDDLASWLANLIKNTFVHFLILSISNFPYNQSCQNESTVWIYIY